MLFKTYVTIAQKTFPFFMELIYYCLTKGYASLKSILTASKNMKLRINDNKQSTHIITQILTLFISNSLARIPFPPSYMLVSFHEWILQYVPKANGQTAIITSEDLTNFSYDRYLSFGNHILVGIVSECIELDQCTAVRAAILCICVKFYCLSSKINL